MNQETKRHVKPLPTGSRISKADRKKLNAAIARTIHRIDAENRAGLIPGRPLAAAVRLHKRIQRMNSQRLGR